MSPSNITLAQKQTFYRDGFVVLPGAVPEEKVLEARRMLHTQLGKLQDVATTVLPHKDVEKRGLSDRLLDVVMPTVRAGTDALFLGLFNETDVKRLVESVMGGPIHPIAGAQIATRFPSEPSEDLNEAGYVDAETPFYGWVGHLDGLWNGAGPIHQRIGEPMTTEEEALWYRDPARNGSVRQFDVGTNIKNFTGLVGIALSDQRAEGCGNLGLLKGAHHEIERSFRSQRDSGGPLGPDGPNWPREHTEAPNGHGLRHYPDAVRDAFCKGAITTPDGQIWPRPTLVKLAPGDAVLVLHAIPHGATRVTGSEPRFMVYYRVTAATRKEENQSIRPEALCDIWLEWEGVRDVARSESKKSKEQK